MLNIAGSNRRIGEKMAKDKKEYKYWDKKASEFDAATYHVVGKETQQATKHWLEDRLKETDRVLELGCGTGHFSEGIAQKVRHLTATDMSSEMLELVKTRLEPFKNVTVKKEDCYHTSFPDSHFDVVFMGNVIHILSQPTGVLDESRRVLKPGGTIMLADSTSYGMRLCSKFGMGMRYLKKFGIPPRENRVVGPDDMTGLLESAGFLVEKSGLVEKETNVVCVRARSPV